MRRRASSMLRQTRHVFLKNGECEGRRSSFQNFENLSLFAVKD
jgi:hypothetical protein